jgi:hypothetical protein
MPERGLFVDFMYAVTVGATLPRLDEKVLRFNSEVLWGVSFLIAVFLEDFYLYHVKVVPTLPSDPAARGFALAMLIIASWYVGQAAFPSKQRVFLVSFAAFFALKLLGGVLMMATKYPTHQDIVFLLPVVAALVLACLTKQPCFAMHPGRLIMVLFPIWLLTIAIWWCMASTAAAATP